MAYKKTKNVVGAVTIGDIRDAIKGRDNDEIVYLDGYAFEICQTASGNMEFASERCEYKTKPSRRN